MTGASCFDSKTFGKKLPTPILADDLLKAYMARDRRDAGLGVTPSAELTNRPTNLLSEQPSSSAAQTVRNDTRINTVEPQSRPTVVPPVATQSDLPSRIAARAAIEIPATIAKPPKRGPGSPTFQEELASLQPRSPDEAFQPGVQAKTEGEKEAIRVATGLEQYSDFYDPMLVGTPPWEPAFPKPQFIANEFYKNIDAGMQKTDNLGAQYFAKTLDTGLKVILGPDYLTNGVAQ